MQKKTISYALSGYDHPGDKIIGTFQTRTDIHNVKDLAEECAEHFYDYNDGVEYTWPLKFDVIYDDKSLGVFIVGLTAEPVFTAMEVGVENKETNTTLP
jgi:hypothetical protein